MTSTTEATGSRTVLGAIAAMDIGMAVQASARYRTEIRGTGGSAVRQSCQLAGVAAVAMAFLAQIRRSVLE